MGEMGQVRRQFTQKSDFNEHPGLNGTTTTTTPTQRLYDSGPNVDRCMPVQSIQKTCSVTLLEAGLFESKIRIRYACVHLGGFTKEISSSH
jgi:hypothetical protein